MTACRNQTTGLTNGKEVNWAPEVEFSPFHTLSRRQLTFPFCCYISLIYSCHDIESEESDLSGRFKTQGTTASYSTGHCATVNKQHSKCLLALITIQKIEIYLKGKLLPSVIYNKAVTCTCDQWPVTYVQPANAYNFWASSAYHVGIYSEVLLQYLSVKIQMAFFNTFSGMKGIRRPDIQLIPAKNAKEIDQIIIIIHA